VGFVAVAVSVDVVGHRPFLERVEHEVVVVTVLALGLVSSPSASLL
jgi:hypothetical protein